MSSAQPIVEHLFRHESGKMIAVLSRIFGIHNLQLVEDVVQEAFLKATQAWKLETPTNPSAWLMRVAKNKAIDIIRRQQNFQLYSKELALQLQNETEQAVDNFFIDDAIADSQLQMIFACCHPSLSEEDRLALTLKFVSGFGAAEIAKALVTNEAAIKKRIYRAREFLKEKNIHLEIPTGNALSQRVQTVYTVLYLMFNEGYNSIKADELIRKDVCAEAMRLGLLLTQHNPTNLPTGFALLSLMCFQASRFESRFNEHLEIVLLEYQDRTKWDRDLIALGYRYLTNSSQGEQLTHYHIEAAIAAQHCLAASFAETNWERMLTLYNLLLEQKNTPVVILNRAVVLSQLNHNERAIQDILAIEGIEKLLASQYIYNAVLGDLYMKSGDPLAARKHLETAIELTNSQAEKKLISDKIKSFDQVSLS